jgi:D-alanyl-D-alanine carboxypeptidase
MDEMNKKAKSIGMENTYYNDPSGLDPKNSSNPQDLLKLVRYIWGKDPSIFAATRVRQFSIKGHTWLNRNAQLPLSGYVGGKNGFIDQALQTTSSIFEIPTLKGGTRKVVIVILKSNDKNGDVVKLINFLKKSVIYTP